MQAGLWEAAACFCSQPPQHGRQHGAGRGCPSRPVRSPEGTSCDVHASGEASGRAVVGGRPSPDFTPPPRASGDARRAVSGQGPPDTCANACLNHDFSYGSLIGLEFSEFSQCNATKCWVRKTSFSLTLNSSHAKVLNNGWPVAWERGEFLLLDGLFQNTNSQKGCGWRKTQGMGMSRG